MANYVPQYMSQAVINSTTDPDTGAVISYTENPLYCLTQDSANQLAALFTSAGLVGEVAMGNPAGYPVAYGGWVSSAQIPYIQFTAGKRTSPWDYAGVLADDFGTGEQYAYEYTNCLTSILNSLR